LAAYIEFFKQKKEIQIDFIIVNNGSTDQTVTLILDLQKNINNIYLINTPEAGKGLAIAQGFNDAVARNYDLIGFVDADMATSPQAYFDLIQNINDADGIIASRYIAGAKIFPPRPFIKRWGSRIFYETLVRLLFGIYYYDYQCGAKLFKYHVIKRIIPYLSVKQWAFDVEILYLCKIYGFYIKEYPTQWFDKKESKLKWFRSGLRMIATLFWLRVHYFNKILFFLFFLSMLS
jgi:glycosyltransferase involved in cell wall biosynthesis